METGQRRERRGAADILAIAFGTTAAMWAAGYICRMPAVGVSAWLVGALMLACMIGGGVVAGRYTDRGWRGGFYAGLLAAILNLLVLGSLLGGDRPNELVPSAVWWLPGALLTGAAVGAVAAAAGATIRRRSAVGPNWVCGLAVVLMAATLLLVVVGGMVTSHEAGLAVVDWPNSYGYNMFLYPLSRMTGGIYYEHTHRLLGSLVGLTMLAVAIQLQRIDSRPWLRRFAWLAFVTVVGQGVLGGLRVTGRLTFSMSPDDTQPSIALAVVHGVLGQVFFCMTVGLTVFTRRRWCGNLPQVSRGSADVDRVLSVLTVVVVAAQLVLGALVRHISWGLSLHLVLAAIIIVAALFTGARAWGLSPRSSSLPGLGIALVALLGVQIVLGIAALVALTLTRDVQPRPLSDVILTTAHQACGALVLAHAVMIMLWTWRLVVPSADSKASLRARSLALGEGCA